MFQAIIHRGWGILPACLVLVLILALCPDPSCYSQSRGTTGTPIGDWKDLRGTNYVVTSATARNNVQMWLNPGPLNGYFDAAVVDQEIGFLAAHGLNTVRVFGSFYAYVINRTEYLTNLKIFLKSCRTHGIYVTFIVWDVFGLDGLEVPVLSSSMMAGNPSTRIIQILGTEMANLARNQPTLPPGWGGIWFASPGNQFLITHQDPTYWPAAMKAQADAYMDDIAIVFNKEYKDTFLSYDLVNEPDNLIYLTSVNKPVMLHIVVKLSAYSMQRILKVHSTAKFTIGSASAYLGITMNQKLKSSNHRGMDYLTYHDYQTGYGFDLRALHARALANLEQLEVVCSECFTAARQGHLHHILGSLDAAGVGGQIWGAIQDRIFVVRYDQAFYRLYPANPTRWWVNDTGVFKPVADSKQPTGWRYEAKNKAFARALSVWANQETSTWNQWPELKIVSLLPNLDPQIYRVTIRGPLGLPAQLLISGAGTTQTEFPGLGIQVLDGTGVNTIFMGKLLPTQSPGQGQISIVTRIPANMLATSLQVQALLGNDYDLRNWEKATQTLATSILMIP